MTDFPDFQSKGFNRRPYRSIDDVLEKPDFFCLEIKESIELAIEKLKDRQDYERRVLKEVNELCIDFQDAGEGSDKAIELAKQIVNLTEGTGRGPAPVYEADECLSQIEDRYWDNPSGEQWESMKSALEAATYELQLLRQAQHDKWAEFEKFLRLNDPGYTPLKRARNLYPTIR